MSNDFQKWLIWNVGGSTAAIAVLVILLLLLGSDISKRASAIRNERQGSAFRLQAVESLVLLRSGAGQAEKQKIILEDSLPDKDQLVGFSKQLESIAKNHQLGFGFSFESETAGSETAPGTNNFTMTLGGAYQNFLRFLKAVEDSKYFVAFDFFDINLKDKEYQIIIKGRVFSQ